MSITGTVSGSIVHPVLDSFKFLNHFCTSAPSCFLVLNKNS